MRLHLRRRAARFGLIVSTLAITQAILLFDFAFAANGHTEPNVVFILLDDVGYGSLGSYGGQDYLTPNIDQIAAEGMRFTNYYSSAAMCSPTRVAILTGLHPARLGVRGGLPDAGPAGIPDSVAVLPQLLKHKGYRTAHFGKWHVGRRHREYRPIAKGYDDSATTIEARDSNGEWILRYQDPDLYIDDSGPVPHSGHLTEILTDYAIDFITRNRDAPFFVNLWYRAAHPPYQAPERWTARFPATPIGAYAAVLAHVDEQIGRLLATLDELGLDNTIIVLTSDNGSSLIQNRFIGNEPLAGGKFTHFEGGIRVPMVLRWPAVVEPGSVFDGIVASIDFFPTFATLAGIDDQLASVDGRSFASTLLSSGAVHPPLENRTLFWDLEVRRNADFGYPEAANSYAVRKGKWKLLVNEYRDGSTETLLFDLLTDPGEQVDLYGQHTRYVTARLRGELRRLKLQSTSIPFLINQVRSTDGSSRLRLATDRRLDAGTDFSAIARINISPEQTASSLPAVLLSKKHSWTLWLTKDLFLRLASPPALGHEILSAAPLELGRWYDIGFSIDFSDVPLPEGVLRDVTLFVEGSSPVTAPLAIGVGSEHPIFINNNEEEAHPFHGTMEGVRFFNSALTSDEVAALVSGEIPPCTGHCGIRLRRTVGRSIAP